MRRLRAMANRASLSYSREFYMPQKTIGMIRAGGKGEKAIREEYTRLRDISQKRLKRMAKDPIFSKSDTYLKNVDAFPKLKDIRSPEELADKLADLSSYISQKTSTLSGAKEVMYKSLETLHENEYTFVTPENYLEFGKFMEQYRFQKLDEEYDSGDAAETYGVLEKHKIPVEQVKADFEYWIENKDTLDKLYKKAKSTGNAAELRAQHERYLKEMAKREKAQLKRMGY